MASLFDRQIPDELFPPELSEVLDMIRLGCHANAVNKVNAILAQCTPWEAPPRETGPDGSPLPLSFFIPAPGCPVCGGVGCEHPLLPTERPSQSRLAVRPVTGKYNARLTATYLSALLYVETGNLANARRVLNDRVRHLDQLLDGLSAHTSPAFRALLELERAHVRGAAPLPAAVPAGLERAWHLLGQLSRAAPFDLLVLRVLAGESGGALRASVLLLAAQLALAAARERLRQEPTDVVRAAAAVWAARVVRAHSLLVTLVHRAGDCATALEQGALLQAELDESVRAGELSSFTGACLGVPVALLAAAAGDGSRGALLLRTAAQTLQAPPAELPPLVARALTREGLVAHTPERAQALSLLCQALASVVSPRADAGAGSWAETATAGLRQLSALVARSPELFVLVGNQTLALQFALRVTGGGDLGTALTETRRGLAEQQAAAKRERARVCGAEADPGALDPPGAATVSTALAAELLAFERCSRAVTAAQWDELRSWLQAAASNAVYLSTIKTTR